MYKTQAAKGVDTLKVDIDENTKKTWVVWRCFAEEPVGLVRSVSLGTMEDQILPV